MPTTFGEEDLMQTKTTKTILIIICFLLATTLPLVATAEWNHDPVENDFLAPTIGTVVTDGFGGAILVTQDPNRGDNLYAYHLNNLGEQVWGSGGVPVYTQHDQISDFEIISDGQGGVYLGIEEFNGALSHIWLQHLSSFGTLPWGLSGVDCAPLITTYSLDNPSLSVTSTGGLIMACEFEYGPSDNDILVQILDTSGNRTLSDLGRYIYNTTDSENNPNIQYDGYSGFYLVSELDTATDNSFYINHLDSASNPDWPTYPAGQLITSTFWDPPVLVVDAAGTAIITWVSTMYLGTSGLDIGICRYFSEGDAFWPPQLICSAPHNQYRPQITPDDNDGCWLLWDDERDPALSDVFMQHIRFDFATTFPENGQSVGFTPKSRQLAHSVLTTDGNLAVTWYDIEQSKYDIYCNIVKYPSVYIGNSSGQVMATSGASQTEVALLPGLNGGVVSHFYSDYMQMVSGALYQRIGPWGFLGDATPTITTIADHPQDQGGVARVTWDSSYLDNFFDNSISEYVLMSRIPGAKAQATDLTELAKATSLPQEDLQALADDGWTFLESVQPYYLSQYASNAATYGDSTSAGIPYTEYLVLCVTSSGILESNLLSGYSVDNISPGAPLALAASSEESGAHLQWTPSHLHDEDLLHYNIYRSADPLVQPNANNFLASSADSNYVDGSLSAGDWHYVVTAMDVHGNESDPSNEVLVQDLSGSASGDSLPQKVAVQGAWPNPFNPVTTIKYALPDAGQIQLVIYDLRGQALRTLVAEYKQPGYHDVVFDGKDEAGRTLASGVYFARLQTRAGVSSAKLVLTK